MEKTTTRLPVKQLVMPDNSAIAAVVALDLGDQRSFLCRIEPDGSVSKSEKLATKRKSFLREFNNQPRLRVALEAGSQSNWIAALLANLGHEVLVVNPRRLKLISESLNKNNRHDAHCLAELALTCPHLLHANPPRSEQTQLDRIELTARDNLVKSRTQFVNFVRGQLKNFGRRVKTCEPSALAKLVRDTLKTGATPLLARLEPTLAMIETLSTAIRQADKRIDELSKTRYASTELMRQIRGVGPLTSSAFALTLDNDPERLRADRDAGAFVGLKPKQRESGSRSPDMPITKLGDPLVRRYLVQCAQYVLSRNGEQSALRRWGLKLVARKLAVLMHVLWSRSEVYEPRRGMPQSELEIVA